MGNKRMGVEKRILTRVFMIYGACQEIRLSDATSDSGLDPFAIKGIIVTID